jgi:chromosome segregation ATPase
MADELTTEILKEIREELRGVNGRLVSMDGRLQSMDGRLESMEGRLESLERTTATGFRLVKEQLDENRRASVERHLDLDQRLRRVELHLGFGDPPRSE